MVDYGTVFKGQGMFFLGFFLILIMNYIVPPLVTAGESIFTGSDLSGIIWFGAILLYIIAGVIAPVILIYMGITTDTGGNPMVNILITILIFIFEMLLTVKGWFMITALSQLTTDGFVLAIFWIGFTISWICCVLVTPAYVVVKEMNR